MASVDDASLIYDASIQNWWKRGLINGHKAPKIVNGTGSRTIPSLVEKG